MLPEPFQNFSKAHLKQVQVAKSETLFRQGDGARGIWYIEQGQVLLMRISSDGFETIVHHARQAEFFAEASLHADQYHCDAICIEPCQAIRIDKNAVLDRLVTSPEFSLQMNKILAKQVQHYRARLELLSINSARERVLAGMHLGLNDHSITAFAAQICLTREAVYRALRELEIEGILIKSGRGRYEIKAASSKISPVF